MNLSSQILIFITKSIPLNEMENREIIATYPIYAILNAGIIGPICEEIAFRGTFKRIIQNKKIYVLLTGFIFGSCYFFFRFNKYFSLYGFRSIFRFNILRN